MRDLFATLFFVSVGMLIDVRFIAQNWPHGARRSPRSRCCSRRSRPSRRPAVPDRGAHGCVHALGMIPVGELNFVLAQAGLQAQALSARSLQPGADLRAGHDRADAGCVRASRRDSRELLRSDAVAAQMLRRRHRRRQRRRAARSARDRHRLRPRRPERRARLARSGHHVAVIDSRLSRVRDGVADGVARRSTAMHSRPPCSKQRTSTNARLADRRAAGLRAGARRDSAAAGTQSGHRHRGARRTGSQRSSVAGRRAQSRHRAGARRRDRAAARRARHARCRGKRALSGARSRRDQHQQREDFQTAEQHREHADPLAGVGEDW